MGCDINVRFEVADENGNWEAVDAPPGFETYRSYAAFGVLANIRNYDRLPFIRECRGLPLDVSASVRTDLEGLACSWLTLREIMDFDLDQQVGMSGHFSPRQLSALHRDGYPSAGYSRTGQPGRVACSWKMRLGDAAPLAEKLQEALKQVARKSFVFGALPSNVRIVFGFD